MLAAQHVLLKQEEETKIAASDPRRGATGGASGARSEAKLDWPYLVGKIRDGDPAGMEELYRLFSRGIRFYLCRQLGPQDLEDKVHDTFLIVVQAIRRGELRIPSG